MSVVEVGVDFRFEAAHWLPNVAEDHKCKRMHGHSYRITVAVTGKVHPRTGMVMDYADIKAAVQPLIDRWDHRVINDFIDNSTAENMAIYVWNWLSVQLTPVGLIVTVHETSTTYCTYRGPVE